MILPCFIFLYIPLPSCSWAFPRIDVCLCMSFSPLHLMFVMIRRKDLLGGGGESHCEASKGSRWAWPNKYFITIKGICLHTSVQAPEELDWAFYRPQSLLLCPRSEVGHLSNVGNFWDPLYIDRHPTPRLDLWLISPLRGSSNKGSHWHLGKLASCFPSQKFTIHISKDERLR